MPWAGKTFKALCFMSHEVLFSPLFEEMVPALSSTLPYPSKVSKRRLIRIDFKMMDDPAQGSFFLS